MRSRTPQEHHSMLHSVLDLIEARNRCVQQLSTPFKAKVERHHSAYRSLSYRQLGLDTVVYRFWKGYAMDTISGRATLIAACDESHIACR